MSLTGVGILFVFLNDQASPLNSFVGFWVGGLLMLPLVLPGAIGAGDMKFMMCFGILMGTIAIFEIFLYSLFWGALIGVLQSLTAGKISNLVSNLSLMSMKMKPTQLHKIPYTVAILFGWLSYETMGGLFT